MLRCVFIVSVLINVSHLQVLWRTARYKIVEAVTSCDTTDNLTSATPTDAWPSCRLCCREQLETLTNTVNDVLSVMPLPEEVSQLQNIGEQLRTVVIDYNFDHSAFLLLSN